MRYGSDPPLLACGSRRGRAAVRPTAVNGSCAPTPPDQASPYASPPSSSRAVPAVASASQARKASTSASGSPISMVTSAVGHLAHGPAGGAQVVLQPPARWWSTVTVASRNRCRVTVPRRRGPRRRRPP